jgi:hypothetical protein
MKRASQFLIIALGKRIKCSDEKKYRKCDMDNGDNRGDDEEIFYPLSPLQSHFSPVFLRATGMGMIYLSIHKK